MQLQLQKAARLQAVLTHMRGAHIIAALRGWRQAAARAKQLRGKAGVVLARWQHLQLSTAWASWCEAHSQQLAKQQVLRGAVSRLQQGAVARCFLHWREAVGRKARLRSMGERVLLRLGQLALGRAWNQVGPGRGQTCAATAVSADDAASILGSLLTSSTRPQTSFSGEHTRLPKPPDARQWRASSRGAMLSPASAVCVPGTLPQLRKHGCVLSCCAYAVALP